MLSWLDIETSGLDPHENKILEVGLIVTTDDLEEIWRTSRVCHYNGHRDPAPVAQVVVDMHQRSGLWKECFESPHTIADVEDMIIAELHANNFTGAPLCGSTIGFDRSFLKVYMPELLACFHYRSIDVSTLTELARRWFPDVYKNRPGADEKEKPHRALADLEFSIACLKYYRERMFVGPIAPMGARSPTGRCPQCGERALKYQVYCGAACAAEAGA